MFLLSFSYQFCTICLYVTSNCYVGLGFCFLFRLSGLLFWYFDLFHVPVMCSLAILWSCHVLIYSCLCVMFWLVVFVMCLVSHWLFFVMWHLLFGNNSRSVAIRCLRLEAVRRRMISVWHQLGTWMSYTHHSAQYRFKSNTPIVSCRVLSV